MKITIDKIEFLNEKDFNVHFSIHVDDYFKIYGEYYVTQYEIEKYDVENVKKLKEECINKIKYDIEYAFKLESK